MLPKGLLIYNGVSGRAHSRMIFNVDFRGLGLSESLFPVRKFIHGEVSEPSSVKAAIFPYSYLMGTFGLCRDVAMAVAKKVQIKDTSKPDRVLRFLKSLGFTKQQIASVVAKRPQLLNANPRTTLKPKVDFFRQLGLEGADFAKTATYNPNILLVSLQRKLEPSIAFLRDILSNDEDVIAVLKSCPRLLWSNSVVLNVQILRDNGLPDDRISHFLQFQPWCMLFNPQKFSALVNDLKGMGFDPECDMNFIWALAMKAGSRNEVWNKKVSVYRSFGWSDSEFLNAFRRYPFIMAKTEENLRKGLDFFMNTVHVKPEELMKYPTMTYALEKTVIPKCSVLNVLMSRGIVDKKCNVLSKLQLSKRKFVEAYVTKYQDEIPEVLDAYQGKIGFKGFGT